MTTIDKLKTLISELGDLRYEDEERYNTLDAINRKFELYVVREFNGDIKYWQDLKNIHFSPTILSDKTPDSTFKKWFDKGIILFINLINTVIEDIEYRQTRPIFVSIENSSDAMKIFIVHGRDDLAKIEAGRFIEKLGLTAIILHEQTSAGKTIIEKIETYSNVGFGIILYSPCDVGAIRTDAGNLQPRARQNVVFEHGYLIGKLGRDRVCALVKDTVETPNDISGVVYIQMDDHQAWQLKLAKELKAAGYPVDMNRL